MTISYSGFLCLGGPTSQHDTIELHGFDDAQDEKIGAGCKKQNKNTKNSMYSNISSCDKFYEYT